MTKELWNIGRAWEEAKQLANKFGGVSLSTITHGNEVAKKKSTIYNFPNLSNFISKHVRYSGYNTYIYTTLHYITATRGTKQ